MTSPLRKRAENAPSSDQRLLDCLCSAPDPVSKAQLAELAELDWNRVVASATKHGVRPLLYERLASVASAAGIPDTVLTLLRESFLVNGLRNVLLYQDLGEVLEGFQQESIPVIVLKGAHLAHLVYETIASRQMADIDLLVKPSDLPKAAARLIKLGYACEIGVRGIPAWHEMHPGLHHLPSFAKPAHPRIEIHWTIPHLRDPGEIAGCWQRARPALIAGIETWVLSPEDLVVHICLHSRLHRFSQGLRPLWDLSQTIRHHQKEIDWGEVHSCARAWQAERCVHLGLWLAKKLMHAPVPESVLKRLQADDFDFDWAALAQEIVLAGEDVPSETNYAMRLAEVCLTWRRSRSYSDKLGLLLREMFPSRSHMKQYLDQKHSLPLNPIRASTCHLTRAIDILGMCARAAKDWASEGRSSEWRRRLRWNRWLDETAS
jgi:hypothetical protein